MADIRVKTATVTNDTNAYADGDQLGELITLSDVYGALHSVVVIDKDQEQKDFTIAFFSSEPTITSSDNAALAITDALVASTCIGTVSVTTEDFQTVSGCGVATISLPTPLPVKSDSGTIYAICIAEEIATYTASGDLVLKFGFVG